MKRIDLRSDTCTLPTTQMHEAMANAEVGNDGFGEDQTVNALEEKAAKLLGKEAALFVASGTMGNLIAFLSHGTEGNEVIMEENHHSLTNEFGGVSTFAHRIPRSAAGQNGCVPVEKISEMIREPGGALTTGLICLENSHNNAGGVCLPLDYIVDVCTLAHSKGIPVHMDGARLFNASIVAGASAKELCAPVDSVMFCLSKGLACPVGSILAGDKAFIKTARHNRKRLGGQMRQAGVLAAAGMVALDHMIERLQDDHNNAKALAAALHDIDELGINEAKVQTNIVMLELNGGLLDKAKELAATLKAQNVLVNVRGSSTIRLVTHKDISENDVTTTAQVIRESLKEMNIHA